MVTRNFKNILALALEAMTSSQGGALPLTDVYGVPRYAANVVSSTYFPCNPTATSSVSVSSAGISVGTGSTPATEYDYNLEATLTSGVSLSVTATTPGVEPQGIPYLEYVITVTNTGSSELTIREIGYKQTFYAADKPTQKVMNYRTFLFDRTVLSAPLTIQAGDAGIIRYRLRTRPEAERTVAGIPMVSWTWGTDEQLAAMLDAAQAGTIDLQTDGGWRVGDLRKIHIDAWTGGNNVAHAAEDLCIVITSFDEYENSGNVLQFDFFDCCTGQVRMNSSSTTVGGYGATEMYITTLPALVEALPAWLKSRLRTFSVQASKGGSELSTAETVTGNKLALRSLVELTGSGLNGAQEGTQVDYYRLGTEVLKKNRFSLTSNPNPESWWTRSAQGASQYYIISTSGTTSSAMVTNTSALAPFGCL